MATILIAALALCAQLSPSAAEPLKQDSVLYRNPEQYAAFPSLTAGPNDQLWVSFGWNTTRSHYGKAAGGKTGGVALYSPDGGQSWLRRGADEGYRPAPEHLAALTTPKGTRVSLGPRMHEVLPAERKQELVDRGVAVKEWPDGHLSASYRVYLRRKVPGEDAWTEGDADLPPFASMGGFGRGCVLADGTLLKPVYGSRRVDDPASSAWILRSTDEGKTWQLLDMASDGEHSFNEAELLALPSGRVLAMVRAQGGRTTAPLRDGGFLWQTHSDDGGRTWAPPRMTELWGYPPHLLLLKDGAILCTYGYRRKPYGIRACLSRDAGATWDTANEVILRHDALPDGPGAGKGSLGDLGYPRSAELSDGTLFTVYYLTLGDGVTHIAATRWSRDYRGPADLPRGMAAVPPPDPSLPPENLVGETGSIKLVYGLMQSFMPTADRVAQVSIRIARESADPKLTHTHGLYVALRKPGAKSWWTEMLGRSRPLKPAEVQIGAWNAFVFDTPVAVAPGQTYVLTVYNLDYLGGGKTRLKDGLTGDHAWYLNAGSRGLIGYPNGGMSQTDETDLAFEVRAESGPVPQSR